MTGQPDRRPRTRLRLTSTVLGWVMHRRWGARVNFYGIEGTSTMETIIHTVDRDGRAWQITADSHVHLARELVTVAASVARLTPTLDAADLRAALAEVADQHAGQVAVVELPDP